MAFILLSIGSNIQPQENIRSGILALKNVFGQIECSPIYESEAVGFSGDNFLNLVVALHTGLTVSQLSTVLRDIENAHGRNRAEPKFSSRTLDIDILTYDNYVGEYEGVVLPRKEILKNAFVLLPMADIVPDVRHPVADRTYGQLWHTFAKQTQQKLWRFDLDI